MSRPRSSTDGHGHGHDFPNTTIPPFDVDSSIQQYRQNGHEQPYNHEQPQYQHEKQPDLEVTESPFSDAYQLRAYTPPVPASGPVASSPSSPFDDPPNTMDNYVYRGTRPPPMAVPPPLRITTAAGQRLAHIVRDSPHHDAHAPPTMATTGPPGMTNAAHARRFFGAPPRESEDKRPPSYSTEMEPLPRRGRASDPFADPPTGLSRNKNGAVRGGWICGILIALAAVLALAVGLGVGLRHRSGGSSAPPAAANGSDSPAAAAAFPIGKWSFKPYLQNVTTGCTSLASTWTCQPGSTYAESPASSLAEFDWDIRASASNASLLLLSASANPFSLGNVTDLPLTAHDVGTADARYTFNTPMLKQVWVAGALAPGIANATTCLYAQTILSATLYVSNASRTYPEAGGARAGGSTAAWPGGVTVQQMATGGQEVPRCYVAVDNAPEGPPLDVLTPQPETDVCSCVWQS